MRTDGDRQQVIIERRHESGLCVRTGASAAPGGHAVIFGAGSVGRGFIAELLCSAGWRVTFLDVAESLVAALAADRGYPHVTVSNAGAVRTVVGPVTAVDARDTDAAVEALIRADLAASCVGARALPAVADTLARAVAKRVEGGRPPLDLLLAENLHDSAAVMRGLLTERLPALGAAELDQHLGLMEASIGRMIPVCDPVHLAVEPTVVYAEPYRLLPYDDAARRGAPLSVPGLVADRALPFAFYSDRKLYVHNMGHFLTACLGEMAGSQTIWEAICDPGIRFVVRAAMVESAVALSTRHGVPLAGLLAHIDDLLHRFGNRALGDTVERVARDPRRKLAPDDRLLGALRLAAAEGLPGHYLSLAVAAGVLRLEREPGQDEAALKTHLTDGLGDILDEARLRLLEAQMAALRDGFDLTTQLTLIEQTYEPSHVL